MCGIVAVIGLDCAKDKRDLALASLTHRGPDAGGQWSSPKHRVWLGHRRLSIVDLSESGLQPLHNEDGSLWLICNGEIYNYPTLRPRLEGLGHKFASGSDSEVILHAYEQWGAACVEELEGMFAFVLWDDHRGQLLAARDRVGIKPLYYAPVGQGLVVASELRAVLPLLPQHPQPDPTAMAYVLSLGYVPCPHSIWQGVHKLGPGHLLQWRAGALSPPRRYWQPPRSLADDSPSASVRWQECFSQVLGEHLLSDVPIGLFLSGGLDSSAVAAGLAELGHRPHTMTVSFPSSPFDEAPIARAVADYLRLPNERAPLQIEDVEGLIDRVVTAFDEPQGYSALLSMMLVSEVAARRFKVVLAGDGGDEVFGGYRWYRQLDAKGPPRASWLSRAARPLLRWGGGPELTRLATQHFVRQSPLHRHAWRLYPRFLPEEVERLGAPVGLRFDDEAMLAPLREHFVSTLPLGRALQRVDLMTFCSDSILPKVDRASMAHSLEVRVPMLDRRIIEWGLRRPPDPREETAPKPVLRDYLAPRVPPGVLDHPKQGFSLRVLASYDWQRAREQIRQSWWVRSGFWSSQWEALLDPALPYARARTWNLLILARWANIWLP